MIPKIFEIVRSYTALAVSETVYFHKLNHIPPMKKCFHRLLVCSSSAALLSSGSANAVDHTANFRLYGEVNRFSPLGFGDVAIHFGVNASPLEIGSLIYAPTGGPGVGTGVLGAATLPTFGFSVIDATFSVPFSLDVDTPGSLYVGLGDNGLNGFRGGSKQVIFDFSDNIFFGGSILEASPNQGLSLESVTLLDGTQLEDAGLSFDFIVENTLLTAGISAANTAQIGVVVDSVFATDPPNSALIGDFTIKAVASAKLKGGPDGVSGPNNSLLSLDINPEPDPLVFDLAFATVSGSNNILLSRVNPPQPPGQSVPAPLPILGLGGAYSFSRKLRRRIARGKELAVASAIN